MTGDVHAISLAHNLLAAMIDNSITHGNKLRIDPLSITWPRVVDVSDRALRKVVIGLGGRENGQPRETGFDIAVASEVMAILGLTTSLKDFRQRLGRIVIGLDQDGQAVTAEQLGTAGAMAVLLRDAIKPTLLQTVENTPVFVHAGPFANIAHGNSSIIADLMGLKMADCVVTESGFGADMGMEKFMNIKCRASGLVPDAVVMVCTVRALKMHSGRYRVVAGRPLDPGLTREDLKAVEDGCANLDKQIENARSFGVPVVVAINAFGTDTPAEVEVIRRRSIAAGAEGAHVSEVWGKGGAGGEELARAVLAAAEKPKSFRFTYEVDWPIKQKIEAIATRIYGADGVDYLPLANQQIAQVHRARLRQPAHLHGQDASVDLARCRAQGAAERISACRSARSAPRWERAFSIPCSARCGRCRGCRPSPIRGRSTSTTTATSSGSSEVSGAVGDLDGGGVEEDAVGRYLADLASAAPAPGGGSAAALAAALGAALVAMTCRVTAKHAGAAPSVVPLGELAEEADSLRRRLTALANDDARVYSDVIAARRLPVSERGTGRAGRARARDRGAGARGRREPQRARPVRADRAMRARQHAQRPGRGGHPGPRRPAGRRAHRQDEPRRHRRRRLHRRDDPPARRPRRRGHDARRADRDGAGRARRSRILTRCAARTRPPSSWRPSRPSRASAPGFCPRSERRRRRSATFPRRRSPRWPRTCACR